MSRLRPLVERFEEKFEVDSKSGCWLWLAGITSAGYGSIGDWVGDKMKIFQAHRVSWELYRGAIPEGLWVLHTCDVRRCVNPSHLFLGDARDNTLDMFKKGRDNRRFGELHGMCTITEARVSEVRKLRADGFSYSQIVASVGVSKSQVCKILNGQQRSHKAT